MAFQQPPHDAAAAGYDNQAVHDPSFGSQAPEVYHQAPLPLPPAEKAVGYQDKSMWRESVPPQYPPGVMPAGYHSPSTPGTAVGGYPPPGTPGTSNGYPPMSSHGGVPPIPGEYAEKGEKRENLICGLRKPIFLAVIAAVALVIIAIAVGVGAGVGTRHNGESADSSPQTSSVSSVPPTSTSSTSTAAPTASGTVSGVPSEATISIFDPCPAQNATEYKTGNGKVFIRYCGIDYADQTEGTNIYSVLTYNMESCLENCAATANCTGAGWGTFDTDKNQLHNCYMKKGLKKPGPHKADGTWAFGVLQPSSSSSTTAPPKTTDSSSKTSTASQPTGSS